MDIKSDHLRLQNNLKLLQKNFSAQELADVVGVAKNTWTARMKEPWRLFSYDDFACIARYCRLEPVDLVFGTIGLKGE